MIDHRSRENNKKMIPKRTYKKKTTAITPSPKIITPRPLLRFMSQVHLDIFSEWCDVPHREERLEL